MSGVALKAVRLVRTFDVKATLRSRPFTLYWSLCAGLVGWANYAQYKRLKPMYPDFTEVRDKEGHRMVEAKRQEFADVVRYNQMVNTMRSDLTRR